MSSGFKPVIYLKQGCVDCAKLLCFISDAKLQNEFKLDDDSKANRMMIKIKLGKVSFPCLQFLEDSFMVESDDIIDRLASNYRIDTKSQMLRAYSFFTQDGEDGKSPAMYTKYKKLFRMASDAVEGDSARLHQQLGLKWVPTESGDVTVTAVGGGKGAPINKVSAPIPAVKLAIFGATGGLGQRLVKQALQHGYHVTAVVRSIEKAAMVLPSNKVMMKIVAAIDESNYSAMVQAISGCDCVLEVVDNTDRVAKVELMVKAVIAAKVSKFIVCGGAGELKVVNKDPTAAGEQRMYEKLGDSIGTWLKPVSLMHLEAQRVVFSSSIPVVAQICPPGMSAGLLSYDVKPLKDYLDLEINGASYEDVAYTVLQALPELEDVYNRSMIGLTLKK